MIVVDETWLVVAAGRRPRTAAPCEPMGLLPTLVTFLAAVLQATAACPEGCHCDTGGAVVCVGDGGTSRAPPSTLPAHTSVLKLRNYGLESLPPRRLLRKELVRLDLSHNLLANLSREAFRGLGGLQALDLGDNRLVRVDGAFGPLAALENLSLRGNALSRLSAATFEGLSHLQHLNLDANQIASLDPAAFQSLPALAHLILSRNPLPSNLSRLDFFGSRLQFVDVSQVGLARVPACLTTHVRDLRLARNSLTRVSAGDFESYPYLGLLVLDDNHIAEVERDALGRLEYLQRLWLNGNALRHVPAALPPSLRALYLEENLLESLPDHCFRGLAHLQQLFLQRNHISTVAPCVFCDVGSLRNLDLQANLIENLTALVFANLTRLESLDLSQNNLKWMDGRAFAGLENLRVLQLSRLARSVRLEESLFEPLRRLQTLEMYNSWSVATQTLNSSRLLHGLRNVQELNVMHNRIQRIRPDLPSFFPFLKLIKLSENEWQCDRDVLWMTKWMHYTSVQFYQSYRITCSEPPELLNQPVILLTEYSFPTTTTQIPLEDTTGVNTTEISNTTSRENYTEPLTEPIVTSTPFVSTMFESTSLPNVSQSQPTTPITTTPLTETTTIAITTKEDTTQSTTTIIYNNETTSTTLQQTAQENETETTKHINPTTEITTTTTVVETDNTAVAQPIKTGSLQASALQAAALDEPKFKQPHHEPPAWLAWGGMAFAAVLSLSVLALASTYRDWQVKRRRRARHIAYSPHNDEISIVTVSEGTVGVRTPTHHGLRNKLYFDLYS
ncbi:hypothetical protein LAZ67_20000395 [Cordylochernes scorpioides]|uniref:Uncharacterized protein n=1 Tax=Cordylochernes scorpioides TaxID=51811 RepID=A0ABY6LLQ3_9ARAC|nr:hypothetical protein LAZ67_20000395 [Cordylochernes scorpioides]